MSAETEFDLGIGMVRTSKIEIKTKGNCHVLNITDRVAEIVEQAGLSESTVTVFNVGSTAGITTTEFEPGLVNHDIEALFERIAPKGAATSTRRPGTMTTGIPTSGPRFWVRP